MEDKNKQIDELLQLLGQQISEARVDCVNPDEKDTNNKRISIDVKKHNKNLKSILRACCVLLCVLIGVTAFTTATSEAFRVKIFGFLFDEKDGYVEMVPSSEKNILYPTYLPEGYEMVSEEEFGTAVEIIYKNKKIDDCIIISQEFDVDFEESIDSDTSNHQRCIVGSYEAYYISAEDSTDSDIHTLVWQRDEVFIEMTSLLEKDEMIKIGASIN